MTDRMRGWLLRGAVLAGLGAVVALGWTHRGRFTPVERGVPVPAYAAPSLAGDTVSLAELRGRVVLLNVWATWCPPCRWEMPSMERLHRRLSHAGLEVVAVSVDAGPGRSDGLGRPGGDVRALVDEWGLTFEILLDPEGRVQRLFGVAGLPTTFLIGRDGRVVQRFLGPGAWDEPPLSELVRAQLEE